MTWLNDDDLCYLLWFGVLHSSDGKESARNAGDPALSCGSDPWIRKIPWKRAWQPTPVFLPGEFHGQRSLAGYGPQGCKEPNTTKGLVPTLWVNRTNLKCQPNGITKHQRTQWLNFLICFLSFEHESINIYQATQHVLGSKGDTYS